MRYALEPMPNFGSVEATPYRIRDTKANETLGDPCSMLEATRIAHAMNVAHDRAQPRSIVGYETPRVDTQGIIMGEALMALVEVLEKEPNIHIPGLVLAPWWTGFNTLSTMGHEIGRDETATLSTQWLAMVARAMVTLKEVE